MIFFLRNRFLSLGRSAIERGCLAMAPASWVWGCVVFCKNFLYERGWIRPKKVDALVVSVGNIVVGGTGKTPFVLLLAQTFRARKLAIITRGYGRVPDEAWLLRRRLPEVPIYIGRDRVRLARRAVAEGAELLILDDAFQHRRMHRDFDIVLALADDPFGRGRFLPWGFLRDYPRRLRQADALFIQGRDFCHAPLRILDGQGNEIESMVRRKVGLFCGIAHPRFFRKTVEDLGADIVKQWNLADHERPNERALEKFSRQCAVLGAECLVTTEKDFVKAPRSSLPIFYIESGVRWLRGEERWGNLIAKINQKLENRKI